MPMKGNENRRVAIRLGKTDIAEHAQAALKHASFESGMVEHLMHNQDYSKWIIEYKRYSNALLSSKERYDEGRDEEGVEEGRASRFSILPANKLQITELRLQDDIFISTFEFINFNRLSNIQTAIFPVRQSTVIRGALCEFVLLLLLVSTLKSSNFAMYSTTNGNEFCGVYRFVVVNFQEEERLLTEGRVSRERVFVQQKCRIVAKLGIEHTSSFLMGFLCPTCGGRYDPRKASDGIRSEVFKLKDIKLRKS
ncbi:hypothetical protein EAG_08594 [Camponotus floridanus]|uniref:Uncharacterized protein n=1 Tax=Camponotus floridanus TaxID=104421 RepID=E1ZWZ1_CAMFO|nr:hypothetical protein EAG_08594 [Camponotus floridanus]